MTPDRSGPGGLAALAAAGVVGALAGPPGLAAGLALVGAWYALGPAYAFAAGQVAVAALLGGAALARLAAAQAAVFAVLVAPDVGDGRGRRLAAGTALGAAALGAAAALAQGAWDATWITAAVVVGGVAVAAYGLHRYELVATGAARGERSG